MGLISNRVERHEIKPGDHIYTYRAVFTYSHHGLSQSLFFLSKLNFIFLFVDFILFICNVISLI